MDAQAQEIAFLQATYLNNYCQLSITALVIFEHVITISKETHLLHTRKYSGAVLLFLLNRYLLLLFGAENLIYVFSWDTRMGCEAMSVLYDVLQLMLYALTAAFAALRVYAINGQRAMVAIIVLVLGLAPVIAGIYNLSQTSYDDVVWVGPYPECGNYNSISDRGWEEMVTMSRAFPIIADLIVIMITCMRTWPIMTAARQAGMTPALVTLLLNDGIVYFLLLASLNAIHIALSLSEGPFFSVVSEFITMFPSILISRFLMNLQNIKTSAHCDTDPSFVQREGAVERDPSHDILRFDIVGCMGGSTDDGGLSALFSTTLLDSEAEVWQSYDEQGSQQDDSQDNIVEESLPVAVSSSC
ncbi:uncharacterized protein C8Q71DRAFT_740046 [Rhodofomes roseus]|uniref:DUF6533 domain-containing protein n=1 Tax=Rhodofomes roseus TaxID=34475 RepID=A0ABQ8KRL9_9APHY|nr:uncharacterized protein C8Q71DRAFT_740046 [Rhodofomes roseus]KAH9840564.1 hypothetical protein C8Q71DRAFT_740046 [Rhodofomes roseus]